MSAHCEEVIVCDERRGAGVEGDPMRLVTVIRRKDGEELAERDPLAPRWMMGLGADNPGGFAFGPDSGLIHIVHDGATARHRVQCYRIEELAIALEVSGPPRKIVDQYREAVGDLLKAITDPEPVDADDLTRLVAAVQVVDRQLEKP